MVRSTRQVFGTPSSEGMYEYRADVCARERTGGLTADLATARWTGSCQISQRRKKIMRLTLCRSPKVIVEDFLLDVGILACGVPVRGI